MSRAIKNIVLILSGFSDYGFAIFGEQSREILADDLLSEQLLSAIDKDKRGETPPNIRIKDKSYKLVRLGETQSMIQ